MLGLEPVGLRTSSACRDHGTGWHLGQLHPNGIGVGSVGLAGDPGLKG